MKLITITTVTVLLFFIDDVLRVDSKPTTTDSSNKVIHACGQNLSDLLKETCPFGYNTYNSEEAEGSSSYGKRKKRGIVEECCKQSCSSDDLLAYCSKESFLNASELQKKLSPEIVARTRITIKNAQNVDKNKANENTDDEYLMNNEINIENSKENKDNKIIRNTKTLRSNPKYTNTRNKPVDSIEITSPRSDLNWNVKKKASLYFENKPPAWIIV